MPILPHIFIDILQPVFFVLMVSRAIAPGGFGMEADLLRIREAGFDEHPTKPVSFIPLYEAVQRVM